ncbi:disulfide isomerase DsbC N-terminal domain-containing protein [Geomonas edaphica]|uniref:disulfide isomerase DsbC N-terminal domain-containing protein n=1 Tax=Geomonas edaphica TaxID=2570226 RepID=UPI0010A7A4F2|nr:disulfide isomerase DsbC N-terminal domain-containing protein [Geomonas edaphica]
MFKHFVVICLSALILSACSKPPAKEQVQAAVKKFIPMNFEVLQVSEVKGIDGLYEAAISVGGHPVIFYVDKKCEYIFTGSMMSTETKANLTTEAQKKFQK